MCKDLYVNSEINSGKAVGVPKKHWFVAIVKYNTEKSCCEKLQKMGYEAYAPIQSETRRWRNGKNKIIDRIVISSIVFLRSSEAERREVVCLPFIKRFMVNNVDKKDSFNRSPIAIIPDIELDKFRFMLCESDVPLIFESLPLKAGDKIRVIRGKLKGLEGNIINKNDNNTFIVVYLDFLGCTKLKISSENIELI